MGCHQLCICIAKSRCIYFYLWNLGRDAVEKNQSLCWKSCSLLSWECPAGVCRVWAGLGSPLWNFYLKLQRKVEDSAWGGRKAPPWGWPGGETWNLNWVKSLGQCRNLREVWETEANTELKHKNPNFPFMLSIRTTFIPVQILKRRETLLLERSSHWRPFAKGHVLAWATASNQKPFYLSYPVTFFLASFHSER